MKNTFLIFVIFFVGSSLIDIFIDNTNVSLFIGLVLAILIVLKPHKKFGNIGSGKKLFSSIPDETIELHRNQVIDQFINGDTWKEQKVKFNLNGFDVRMIIQGVIHNE